MGEFESYDLRCWMDGGITTAAVHGDKRCRRTTVSGSKGKSVLFGVALAALLSVASSTAFSEEPAQAATFWRELVSADKLEYGIADSDVVPAGYWQRLVNTVKTAKPLSDNEPFFDPDPLF